MRRVIKDGPGVLAGISVSESYDGESVLFYDNEKLVCEVELDEARPARVTKGGMVPGIEFDPPHFFRKNIVVEHSEKIQIEPTFA